MAVDPPLWMWSAPDLSHELLRRPLRHLPTHASLRIVRLRKDLLPPWSRALARVVTVASGSLRELRGGAYAVMRCCPLGAGAYRLRSYGAGAGGEPGLANVKRAYAMLEACRKAVRRA